MIPARREDEAHVSGLWVGAEHMKSCGTEPWHKAVHFLELFVLRSIDLMCDPALLQRGFCGAEQEEKQGADAPGVWLGCSKKRSC